jgi:hypothetical protein
VLARILLISRGTLMLSLALLMALLLAIVASCAVICQSMESQTRTITARRSSLSEQRYVKRRLTARRRQLEQTGLN